MTSAKPYHIAKRVVWEAYQLVRANGGAAGVDDETIAMFEQNLSGNLYKLWNRMSSGSYFPPPVRQVEIPKAKGGTRKLGVPTVSDRIAQTAVKLMIEPALDPIFHEDSYGYRPRRSAKQAISVTRKRCWQYDWVVEFDIKAAFDQIDHTLLMRAVRNHIKEDWILLYIERWLTAPFETADGASLPRTRGTPQGGVVSPILMNLFMHYAFDSWIGRTWPQCPFARYADDAVVHCRTQAQAEEVMRSIASRLEACGLTMHPEKSKIVYCRDSNRTSTYPNVQFTFLGFTFRPREALNTQHNRRFTSFLPAVSNEALKRMRKEVREWRLHRRTSATLADLAEHCNLIIQGWWNYYGAFYQRAIRGLFRYIDSKLWRWARRKYKTLARRKLRSVEWLRKIKEVEPRLFTHWRLVRVMAG
ncbi:group II intron reverse transcriptase/maturase [Paraburkholderia silvatlantica]|uniref:Group II intron reverse transcriptase/maturase n=1 Tax=Paraburkholderia silvatlantica TaxID=321895 RepID=A0ABR6FGX5_9BURK|nr:group II intron reverse transcriptase/maturase [Paraburkholderia silvatlantica]MBB2926674.1 group II intron reverse transcriptase/maturase [Paraburkholderia silvatlantica]PVY37693.1 group II intron reverse transcriptase/maturase [Paraburkholderia silvatlantica]PXW42656.1 group II intron reverse transcriptase/maturase [Paraburkholderia silvatlantica]